MSRFWLVLSLYYQSHLRQRSHMVFLSIALFVFVLDSLQTRSLDFLRTRIEKFVAPINYPIASTHDGIRATVRYIDALLSDASYLMQMQDENQLLRQWYQYAQALEKENRQLKQYFSEEQQLYFDHIQHFRLSGSDEELTKPILHIHLDKEYTLPNHAAVISDRGMVGRILHSKDALDLETAQANSVAKVMLLSHPKSSIPVQVGKHEIQAILRGQGKQIAKLDYYFHQDFAQIQLNDPVFSSGYLGYLPSGLPVGTVVRVTPNQIDVQLVSNPAQLRYVGVIKLQKSVTRNEEKIKKLLQTLRKKSP